MAKHPKPSPLFPLDLSVAFIKPDFRYIDFCRKREVLPNDAIVSSFSKAKLQKSCFERSILQVLLDLLMDVDVPPLIETFSLMGSYEIDAIDIINESPCVLKREKCYVIDARLLRYKTMLWMQLSSKETSGSDQTTPDQPVDDEGVYYKVAVDCPKGCVYSLRFRGYGEPIGLSLVRPPSSTTTYIVQAIGRHPPSSLLPPPSPVIPFPISFRYIFKYRADVQPFESNMAIIFDHSSWPNTMIEVKDGGLGCYRGGMRGGGGGGGDDSNGGRIGQCLTVVRLRLRLASGATRLRRPSASVVRIPPVAASTLTQERLSVVADFTQAGRWSPPAGAAARLPPALLASRWSVLASRRRCSPPAGRSSPPAGRC
ncbi:hypothetical protein Scep_003961 [Stephania cephalantha]|uniref:DWD hypersensitive to UV-B 1 N-terminal domain-containing protein n=1 Tax=Stephania cephalantha TaxID=152367 RepID=A0AAP0PUX0_9MAGN